jgi:vacuolar-type H+-ATPase subunit H
LKTSGNIPKNPSGKFYQVDIISLTYPASSWWIMVYDEIARIKLAENHALKTVSEARTEAEQLLDNARAEASAIQSKSTEAGWAEVRRTRAEGQRIAELAAAKIRREGEEHAAKLRKDCEPKLGDAARHVVNRIIGNSDVLPF